jgi:hypothetical protein
MMTVTPVTSVTIMAPANVPFWETVFDPASDSRYTCENGSEKLRRNYTIKDAQGD